MMLPAIRINSDLETQRIGKIAYQAAYDSYLNEDYGAAIQVLESEFSKMQMMQLNGSIPLSRALEIYCWCLQMQLKYEVLERIRERYSHVDFGEKSLLPIIFLFLFSMVTSYIGITVA